MHQTNVQLPPEAAAALKRGEVIQAIKLTREARGVDLRSAKRLVEDYQRAMTDVVPKQAHGLEESSGQAEGIPQEVLALVRGGHKLEAIKLLRDSHDHLGLKEAKDIVEALAAGDREVSIPAAPVAGPVSVTPAASMRTPTVEDARGGGAGWVLFTVLIALALLGWWLL